MTIRKIRNAHQREVSELLDMPPWERFVVSRKHVEETYAWISALGSVRYGAVLEMRAAGMTYPEIGEMVGCSPAYLATWVRDCAKEGRPATAAPKVAAP